MNTAEWADSTPATASYTRTAALGGKWMARKVRPDLSVILGGHRYRPTDDVVTLPVSGEWLLFYTYGRGWEHLPPQEWTAPADPDGYLRRADWRHVCCESTDSHIKKTEGERA